jgi:hypothetical protein
MKSRAVMAVVVGGIFLAVTGLTFAHHTSAGLFNIKDQKTLKGTVQKWLFVNPHVAMVIDIKNEKGQAETWRAEFTSPNGLKSCCDLTRTSLKPGDQVTIFGHPYLNDIKALDAIKLTMPNGNELVVRNDAAPEYETGK